MERLLLRPTEVMETMGLSRSTVYALIASGIIPSIRIGRAVRVPADSLREWIAHQLTEQSSKSV